MLFFQRVLRVEEGAGRGIIIVLVTIPCAVHALTGEYRPYTELGKAVIPVVSVETSTSFHEPIFDL